MRRIKRTDRAECASRLARPALIERLEARRFLSGGASGPESVITPVLPPRQVEFLDRGVVAFRTSVDPASPAPPLTAGDVYVSWRMLGTDSATIAFNLYRSDNGGPANLLNGSPLMVTTDYVDHSVNYTQSHVYSVRPVIGGIEQATGGSYTLPANVVARKHIDIPLSPPVPVLLPDGQNAYTYSANDASVGDVDGDGQYEIFLKWDPSNSKDNSQAGYTGPVFVDCYRLDGTRLWRINMGQNIRAGAHYTQFVVYDFDGDGSAEVAMRTAPGTIDGPGNAVLMGSDQVTDDYRNVNGYIITGPEYLTMFNGQTGAAMATTAFLPDRVNVNQWGDTGGNRVDRFLGGVAYLDGQRPSLVLLRGYYNARLTGAPENVSRNDVTAWDWRGGTLSLRWMFKAGFNINSNINSDYIHGGGHYLTVADVDGDGKDEIVNNSNVIDDNGAPLYTTGLGHGDAMMVTDMIPDRPGQEVFMPHEVPGMYTQNGVAYAASLQDARTGELLMAIPGSGDVGRGNAFDIDPNYPGFEMWNSSDGGIWNVNGTRIMDKPSNIFTNMGIWWDADPLRELEDGTTISDWIPGAGRSNLVSSGSSGINNSSGLASNNGTKSTPALIADLFGDWREEIIWRQSDNLALQIWSTTIPATNRIYTLMHDVQYRESVASQQTGYNQPTVTSFFLGAADASSAFPVIPAANVYTANGVVPAAPPAPTGLAASLLAPQGVSLTWNASAGATSYRVLRGNTNGGPYVTIAFVDSASYSDLNRAPGQTYFYVVAAIGPTGESGNSAQASQLVSGNQTNYAAETASFGGGSATSVSGSGFTGSYVTFPSTGGFLQFNNINGGAGGIARLNFRFSQGFTGSSTDPGRAGWLYINGVRQVFNTRYTGSEGSGWTLLTVNANLNHGLNIIRLESTGQDLGNIDELQVTVIPDTTQPTVVGQPIYAYSSLPNSLSFTFSESVQPSLTSADLLVEKLDILGNVVGTVTATLSGYNSGTNTATFALNDSLILDDGNYRATLNSSGVADLSGNALSGALPFSFFVLAGDANHDRIVNVYDLLVLANNWLGTGKTFADADFNYDGVVNATDLGILGLRWQQKVDAPPQPSAPIPTAARRPAARTPTRIIDLVQ